MTSLHPPLITSMAVRGRVAKKSICNISIQAQQIFKPYSLHYTGPRDTFDLMNLMVGKNIQDLFVDGSGPPISMDNFRGPDPETILRSFSDIERGVESLANARERNWKDDARVHIAQPAVDAILLGMDVLRRYANNLGGIDVVNVAMNFTLTVRNNSYLDEDFECLVYGVSIEGVK